MNTPREMLAALVAAPPLRPRRDLPEDGGLYLLHDHTGVARYIGESGNLRWRVWSNHCVGDLNSHKWVCRYNHGRLWSDPRAAENDAADGQAAKAIRAAFARRYCSVRILVLQEHGTGCRKLLETDLRRIAPDPMNDWNDQKRIRTIEPRELVDRLLDELGAGAATRAQLDRQEARWARAGLAGREVALSRT